jgi:hypothetical protein
LRELAELYGTASGETVLIEGSITHFDGSAISTQPPLNISNINDGDDSTYSLAEIIGGLTSPRPFVPDNLMQRRWTIDLGASYEVAMLKRFGTTPEEDRVYTWYSADGMSWTDLGVHAWRYLSNIGGVDWHDLWLPVPTMMRYVRIGYEDFDPGNTGASPYWGCQIHALSTFQIWGWV